MDYTEQILLELVRMNEQISFMIHLSYIVVVITGVILTLMLFYKMLKRFM